MTPIPYSFNIVSVDPEAKCMVVLYSSPNREDIPISTRLPYAGESVEAIVQMYAPISYWMEKEIELMVPEVGTVGTFLPPEDSDTRTPLEKAKDKKLAEIAYWRWEVETKGILIGGYFVKTDREDQAMIGNAYTALKEGFTTEADFKTGTGWIKIGLAELTPIAQAVAQHVQSCFTAEKELADLVNAAETVEQVQAVVVPEVA